MVTDGKRKRLTLDLERELQRRLKARAALNGVTMRQYCKDSIQEQMGKGESQLRSDRQKTGNQLEAVVPARWAASGARRSEAQIQSNVHRLRVN